MEDKVAFCAVENKDSDHSVELDKNNELVVTCKNCGHFVKFLENTDLDAALAEHKEANEL